MGKRIKAKKVDAKPNTNVTRTYRLYMKVDGKRKYIGSIQKVMSDGVLHFDVPPESWTWKREAALRLWTAADARNLAKMLWFNLKVEERIEVEEWAI